uniref:Uncharacterized protein n=1 Tax=Oryza barthii TaxID=65489 RepID=A0A0D3FR83_9ORYZ
MGCATAIPFGKLAPLFTITMPIIRLKAIILIQLSFFLTFDLPISENPQSCSGNKCSFCPEQYQIAHPSEQELLCGKEEHVKDFIRLMNLSPMPFTCPTEPPEIGIVIEQ